MVPTRKDSTKSKKRITEPKEIPMSIDGLIGGFDLADWNNEDRFDADERKPSQTRDGRHKTSRLP
jgi:hypothetical protein